MKAFRIKSNATEGDLCYIKETVDGVIMCTKEETKNGGTFYSEDDVKRALRRVRDYFKYSNLKFTKELFEEE